jgi:hypothetical protein
VKKRSKKGLRRRYGRAHWSSGDVQRLLDVPASKGEVIVSRYPNFTEVVAAPARGSASSEMVFFGTDRDSQAKVWGERQAKRFLGAEVSP